MSKNDDDGFDFIPDYDERVEQHFRDAEADEIATYKALKDSEN
ncbi:hypothetical protein [Cedecea neteri]|nr:hypothetical protein [Cedecea neteri]